MNREDYLTRRQALLEMMPRAKFGDKLTADQKDAAKVIRKELYDMYEAYIKAAKPCDIGDVVTLTLNSGRKAKNVKVLELGVLQDGNVHPTAYQDGTRTCFITVPIQRIEKHV